MKVKLIGIVLISCFFAACNSSEDKTEEPPVEQTTEDTLFSSGTTDDSTKTVVNRPMIWTVDQESSGTDKLKKPDDVRLDTFSSTHLVQLINDNFPDVHLDLVKISHDTMYVKIPDSKILTQEMGSTGAQNYMVSATYTLTEFKNVKFINFALKEGDHAGPGVFSRDDFDKLR